jgi:hypothetical protein
MPSRAPFEPVRVEVASASPMIRKRYPYDRMISFSTSIVSKITHEKQEFASTKVFVPYLVSNHTRSVHHYRPGICAVGKVAPAWLCTFIEENIDEDGFAGGQLRANPTSRISVIAYARDAGSRNKTHVSFQ